MYSNLRRQVNHETSSLNLANEFARIVSCTRCDNVTCRNILRDAGENIPQPGFIGELFHKNRILLVGQNPGVPGRLSVADLKLTAALRHLRDRVSIENWRELQAVLEQYMPLWPVQNYFPLQESGLTLRDIAYCNIARCRTKENRQPGNRMASNCASSHFAHWLDLLKPRAVVFIGKWAHGIGERFAQARHIPYDFMDRDRSLSSAGRMENRQRVASFVWAITH